MNRKDGSWSDSPPAEDDVEDTVTDQSLDDILDEGRTSEAADLSPSTTAATYQTPEPSPPAAHGQPVYPSPSTAHAFYPVPRSSPQPNGSVRPQGSPAQCTSKIAAATGWPTPEESAAAARGRLPTISLGGIALLVLVSFVGGIGATLAFERLGDSSKSDTSTGVSVGPAIVATPPPAPAPVITALPSPPQKTGAAQPAEESGGGTPEVAAPRQAPPSPAMAEPAGEASPGGTDRASSAAAHSRAAATRSHKVTKRHSTKRTRTTATTIRNKGGGQQPSRGGDGWSDPFQQ